ncbi:MAG: hypothetical protein P1P87_00815 [Trueperaceae bacterium]|nr:hypothetical protein [Trueperaceae bacterium]
MSRFQAALVRASLLWLVATALLGVVFQVWPGVAGLWRTTHVHMGVLGFFLSMVTGVAYWMMPRPGGLRQEGWEAVTFTLLHGGLLLRVIAEPQWRRTFAPAWQWASTTSGMLLLAAVLSFAIAMHARVVNADTLRRLRVRREGAAKR